MATTLLQSLMESPRLLDQVNAIWRLLVYRERAEHFLDYSTLFFLLLLGFNKASFMQTMDTTLQHLTLRVRKEVAIEREELKALNKNRTSFVYNSDFLICDVVSENDETFPQDILIRI